MFPSKLSSDTEAIKKDVIVFTLSAWEHCGALAKTEELRKAKNRCNREKCDYNV